MKIRLILILLLFSCCLFAKLKYSHRGYLDFGTIHRISDGSIIKVPYRMITYESNIAYKNLNFIFSSALEFRLKNLNNIFNSKLSYDQRELYIEWLSPIGDISFGKQILSWGSASENNPTDIISPYNYYYLFSVGKEKKEGILSLNSTIYFNSFTLNSILIPNHNPHILPLNDPDFSISSPIVPKDEQINKLNNPFEYGLFLNIPFDFGDITTSFFSGYDRIVSFFGANVWSETSKEPSTILPDTVLSYRKTKMFGIGFTKFIGNVSLKGDFGYFSSDDNISIENDSSLYRDWPSGKQTIINRCEEKNAALIVNPIFGAIDCTNEPTFNNTHNIDNRSQYYQYVIELEYSPNNDIHLISQLSKSKITNIGIADSINVSTGTIMLDPKELFIPGIGHPNAFISSNSISILGIIPFLNQGLSLKFSALIDLDKKGSINEIGSEYDLNESTKILFAINKIIPNKKLKLNPLIEMENFSHIRIELKYFY